MPTQQQQEQLLQLQQVYQQKLASWQDAVRLLNDARNAAQLCQSRRDQYSLGWQKNQACHIDQLGALNANWNAWSQTEATRRAQKDAAYQAIADFQQQIDAEIQQGVNALQTDPEFNLQTQQINAAAAAAKAAADAKAKEAEAAGKRKKTIIIAVIIASVIVITAVSFFIFKAKRNGK